jgi:hypothetical protein
MRASRRMRWLRGATLGALLVLFLPATAAFAQISVDPTVTPELNTGGWIRGMAVLLGIIGVVVILLMVAAYLRFAPRFSSDESSLKVVRADRVRPGEELPRRTVDIKAAQPVVVAPPPLPQPVGVAAAAPAPAAVPATAAPAPARTATPQTAPADAPAQAGPGAEAPSTEAPRAEPSAPAEADAATEARETPDAAVSQPAPAPAPAAHAEVTMDQEVFEKTLQELLDKGTDKRVAEGQARRAGMIAARKKAAGEA